uniref:Sushi domain containing 3 n=1 Tax=Nothobranchius furzeri TaxID=105023 RepID=A0A8C6Q124_NOTFU
MCSSLTHPPALGTQRIIQGNGTNVGSIVSLQCPARHKLVGKDLMCVMGSNSTQWVGQTYCQPLSFYEDYGFRVAVLSSIISSGIILLLSVAFITCCLLNCIKEDSKKRPRLPSPQPLGPAPPGESQGVPWPGERHSPPTMSWVYL